jgi:hypothetical protein
VSESVNIDREGSLVLSFLVGYDDSILARVWLTAVGNLQGNPETG